MPQDKRQTHYTIDGLRYSEEEILRCLRFLTPGTVKRRLDRGWRTWAQLSLSPAASQAAGRKKRNRKEVMK